MLTGKTLITVTAVLFLLQFSYAQDQRKMKAWNPETDTLKILQGQGWSNEPTVYYGRLPSRAEQVVRKDVWDLAKNSAGLSIRFRTNTDEVIVKYIVTGGLQMPHMPATGVSGVDLYSKDINGKWLWNAAKYTFGDTIVYHYTNLATTRDYNTEYCLYLPLYNTVKWMEISVPGESLFKPEPQDNEKPIVLYGTSIAQGACASRPGMAWTAILGRKLDRPIINLGFSGNGRLEKEVLGLVTEIDARLYILDCMPNMVEPYFDLAGVRKRIAAAVKIIQAKRPGVPIILTEYDGFIDEDINSLKESGSEKVNHVVEEIVDSLRKHDVANVFILSKEDIGQDMNSTVDGIHSNDLGMLNYANAYEKKIRSIFNEASGSISTTIPVTQSRDGSYDWQTRHHQVLEQVKMHPPDLVFVGNSITHYWDGEPVAPFVRGRDSWVKYFSKRNTVNLGFGADRIENVLWRVNHGELDGFSASRIVLMIGTNNLQWNTDQQIVDGLTFLIPVIHLKQPNAKIYFLGILPRQGMENRIVQLNKLISKIPLPPGSQYFDAGQLLLNKDKKINSELFIDGLHPNASGYEKLGAFLNKKLKN